MNYRLAYRVGFHPWEDAAADQIFVDRFRELIDLEEGGASPPYGQALDLGTGSGIWGIELAKRGWQVTGVDNVPRALWRARQRIREQRVEMRLMEGDVTDLSAAGVGDGYRLLLDTGTFHGLAPHQQRAMGASVGEVAAPDATVLLLVWPRRRRPLIRGADRGEIEQAFHGWKIIDVMPSFFRLPKPLEAVMRPDEHWYRLRRS
jgi:SAM-dependent methyltransferase